MLYMYVSTILFFLFYISLKKTNVFSFFMLDFLAASCTNLISLSFGLTPAFFTIGNIYLSSYSLVFCKVQGCLTHTSLQMTRMFLVAACVDRYTLTSSNANIRKFGQVSVAYRIIPMIIIGCLLIAIHLVIYLNNDGDGCGLKNSSALIYNTIYSIITISLIMPLSMVVFSLLTYYNLRKRREQRRQLQQQLHNQQEKQDQMVLFTLMMQLLLYFISTALYAPYIFYGTITQNMTNKSFDRQILDAFINGLSVTLIYIYPAFSFFAYTLASKTFRNELLKLFRLMICRHQSTNAVMPFSVTA